MVALNTTVTDGRDSATDEPPVPRAATGKPPVAKLHSRSEQPISNRPAASIAMLCGSRRRHFAHRTGRALCQFNAGTTTSRSQTQQLRPNDLLLVSPADAHTLGVRDDQIVHITSRYGQATICASISIRVRPGELFATYHSPDTFLNRVISGERDRFEQTPEYKVTAVRV